MHLEYSDAQRQEQQRFRAFAQQHIVPFAAEWERREATPPELIDALRAEGLLGAIDLDPIVYGLLTEEIGRACSSIRSLLTVHDMVTLALRRWGSPRVKEELVPRMLKGELLGALGLSEAVAGSDAAGVQTQARQEGDTFVLQGGKKWITYGQIADVFLVLAQLDGAERKPTAFVVEAARDGFSRSPITGIMGTAASMVAELQFDRVRLPLDQRVGSAHRGMTIAQTALQWGRYSVAWGSVGIAQACLDASLDYTQTRQAFGQALGRHQLVQRLLTEMKTNTRAARLLCLRAGHLLKTGSYDADAEIMVAKYFASRTAAQAAVDAVQLHGAAGVSTEYPVARYLRDSRIPEIIEGSTQIQQTTIADLPLGEF